MLEEIGVLPLRSWPCVVKTAVMACATDNGHQVNRTNQRITSTRPAARAVKGKLVALENSSNFLCFLYQVPLIVTKFHATTMTFQQLQTSFLNFQTCLLIFRFLETFIFCGQLFVDLEVSNIKEIWHTYP